VPTLFVGVHGALVVLVALLGLSFLLDPCPGGGDLCLGGVLGLISLGVAGYGAVGLTAWRFERRASPLLVLDCLLVAVLGPIGISAAGDGPTSLAVFGLQIALLFALVGVAITGRAVVAHRLETILSLAVLASLATLPEAGGIGVLIVGMAGLAVGWALTRTTLPARPTAEPPTATA
jgi:hypothetical protein